MTILLATNNKGKVKEAKAMLQSGGVKVITLSELGLVLVPEETGNTFAENATIKAMETASFLKLHGHEDITVLADDSGIEIDALPDILGVDSANFLGEDTSFDIRNAKILELLAQNENRSARFVSVIVCVFPNGEKLLTHGEVEGVVSHEIKGENGFGYDPIFYLPKKACHMAELSDEEKNSISHRGEAMRKMVAALREKGILS